MGSLSYFLSVCLHSIPKFFSFLILSAILSLGAFEITEYLNYHSLHFFILLQCCINFHHSIFFCLRLFNSFSHFFKHLKYRGLILSKSSLFLKRCEILNFQRIEDSTSLFNSFNMFQTYSLTDIYSLHIYFLMLSLTHPSLSCPLHSPLTVFLS